MSVSFMVPAYRRLSNGMVALWTVGLGEHDAQAHARSESDAKRQLVGTLREKVRAAEPGTLRGFDRSRGTELQRHRLQLKVGRRKIAGVFPVVLQRRATSEGESTQVAFHPLLPKEVLPLDPEQPVADQMRIFFGRAFAELEDEALESMSSSGRDGLIALAFDGAPRSLLDTLKSRKGLWDDLLDNERSGRAGASGAPRRSGLATLREQARDLTREAADEELELGRTREPARGEISSHLTGARRSSFVLLGPAGCGKRTLIAQAVADLLEVDGYRIHRNLDKVAHVYAVAASRLIAGMSFLGQWEERIVDVVAAARGQRAVLYFEDLHTLGRVGRSRESERCFADVLRGPIARREVVVIGACTQPQWQRLQEDVPGFASLFATVTVEPTDRAETLAILLHEARRIEAREPRKIDTSAFRVILETGAPALALGSLPGAAIELLRRASLAGDATDSTEAVLSALEEKTGMPRSLFGGDESPTADDVAGTLARRVMGQKDAIAAAAQLVVRISMGMTDPARPFGAYLFTGPTGTGKTELAKALAQYLYGDDASRLLRFDMGEFAGGDAVPRLMGDRYEPRGLLTEAVRQQPYSVVLLDEIEKAHPAVLHLLLQLLDDGRLTDAAGDRADFRRAVIVMTSNLGASPRAAVGFADPDPETHRERVKHDVARAVREFFPPELFNRIERVVPFHPLDHTTAVDIARKELAEVLARRGLSDRDVFVIAHRSAAERIAAEAFDGSAGARSVKRYLELHVTSKIAEHLASERRPLLEILRLYADADGYQLVSEPLREAEPGGESSLGPLVDASMPELMVAAAQALAFMRDLEASRIARVSEAIQQRLATLSPASGEVIHHLDALRAEIARVSEKLETITQFEQWREEAERETEVVRQIRRVPASRWRDDHSRPEEHRKHARPRMQAAPRRTRDELLSSLADVAFLRRVLQSEHPEEGHAITLELLTVGPATTGHALLPALASFYEREFGGAAGEIVAAAARAPGSADIHEGSLETLLLLAPDHLAVTIVGTGVHHRLGGERGCHAHVGGATGSSIVRVRMHAPRTPRELLEEHDMRRREYEMALEEGVRPPTNPDALEPLVRRYTFEEGPRGRPVPYEIEDFRLQHVLAGQSRDPMGEIRLLLALSLAQEEPS